MTVGIAKVCKDGLAVIPDTLIVFPGLPDTSVDSKISGKIGHVIMAFSGDRYRFRLFEEIVGLDVELNYLKKGPKYTDESLIADIANWVKKLNQDAKNTFDILVARHRRSAGNATDLHYISSDGNHKAVQYIAIGSGKYEADKDLSKLNVSDMTMAEFTVEALISILRIERDCQTLGISIKNMKPEIRWFKNGANWDVAPDNLDSLLEEARRKMNERFPKNKPT